jgi:hypothetical protein
MIDIESSIVYDISQALTPVFDNVIISTEYVPDPPTFPHVSIEEADNYTNTDAIDSSGIEKFVNVMYEINIHTNDRVAKKSHAKTILNIIDDLLIQKGFSRTLRSPQLMNEGLIYRLVARYTGVVAKDMTIYRR